MDKSKVPRFILTHGVDSALYLQPQFALRSLHVDCVFSSLSLFGGIAFATQEITLIITHFSVEWSVCVSSVSDISVPA